MQMKAQLKAQVAAAGPQVPGAEQGAAAGAGGQPPPGAQPGAGAKPVLSRVSLVPSDGPRRRDGRWAAAADPAHAARLYRL
jgi:hypothetical protein